MGLEEGEIVETKVREESPWKVVQRVRRQRRGKVGRSEIQVQSRFPVLEEEGEQGEVEINNQYIAGANSGPERRFIKRKVLGPESGRNLSKGQNSVPLADITNFKSGDQSQKGDKERQVSSVRNRSSTVILQNNLGNDRRTKPLVGDYRTRTGMFKPGTVFVEDVGQYYGNNMQGGEASMLPEAREFHISNPNMDEVMEEGDEFGINLSSCQ